MPVSTRPSAKTQLSFPAPLPKLFAGELDLVFAPDASGHLWRYEPGSRQLQRQAVGLPEGPWDQALLSWARDHRSDVPYSTIAFSSASRASV